jgi:selenocysteine lyase/cysteine desulfurase
MRPARGDHLHPLGHRGDQPGCASFAGPRIGEGDEIVLSIMEHHSNIMPWHFHRERKGAVIKWVDVRDDGSFDLDAFAAALTTAPVSSRLRI